MEHLQDQPPWYRIPLVWMLISIPASAVLMGVIMIWLAVDTEDGLVVDDYYRHGKTINKVLKRDMAATRYGLSAKLMFNVEQKMVNVELTAKPNFDYPDKISIRFLNATQEGLDKELTLTRANQGHYATILPPLNKGRWYVQIEATDWRLLGSLSVPGNKELHIIAIE
jgi:hypothetical protein